MPRKAKKAAKTKSKPATKAKAVKKKAAKTKAAKKLVAKTAPAKKAAVKKAAARKTAPKKTAAKKKPALKLTRKAAPAKAPAKTSPPRKVARKSAVKTSAAPKAVRLVSKPAPKPVVPLAPAFDGPSAAIVKVVLAALDDAKAENTVALNIAGRSSMADAMVITTGRVDRHVAAIANQLLRRLKDHHVKNVRIEGQDGGDWCLVDAGDVIVHFFRPEVRAFYNLEKLWSADAPRERA